MRFFEDFAVPKELSIGITNLLSTITTREGSHKGGWTRLLKCQLTNLGYPNIKILDNKDSLSDFDVIMFDLGAEYSGALNLFGGLDEKVFKRLNEVKNFKGQLFSWKHELPDISALESRRTNASTCGSFKSTPLDFLPLISKTLKTTKTFDHAYKTANLLIGDSHTPSVWTPAYMIERRDGRTLKGMIERNTVSKYVSGNTFIKTVLVHCSSIDIRHHACRENKPLSYVLELSQNLVNELNVLKTSHGIDFNIVETMGIEDESRELPKTGYFKGKPFYGCWGDRNELREVFNRSINLWTNGCSLKFPEYFFDESGKLRFDVMEGGENGSSVHISPEHYRTNLDTGMLRWK